MKKYNNFQLFFIGLIVGFGKILPGISGALIAISFNIYDRIIKIISSFWHLNKDDFYFCFFFGTGLVISIIFGSKAVIFLLNNYYFFVIYFLLGLILSDLKIPVVKNKCLFTIPFVILLFFYFIVITSKYSLNIKISSNTLFLVGIIESLTIIIPGLSGSAILMALGFYEFIMFNLSNILCIYKLFPFFAGSFIGLIVISNIIQIIIKKYAHIFNFIVFIITIFSTGIIIYQNPIFKEDFLTIFLTCIFFITGIIIGNIFER